MSNLHAKTRKKGILHRFYLIEPRPNANADELAEKLISLKPVEEVFLSDGAYGFIVKVRFLNGKEPSDVVNYIRSRMASRFGTVDSYYQYRK